MMQKVFAGVAKAWLDVHHPGRGAHRIDHSPEARADIRSLIAVFDRRIAKVEVRMAGIITADPELTDIDRRRQTVPGVNLSPLRHGSPNDRNLVGWTAGGSRLLLAWRRLRATAASVPHIALSVMAGPTSGRCFTSQHFTHHDDPPLAKSSAGGRRAQASR